MLDLGNKYIAPSNLSDALERAAQAAFESVCRSRRIRLRMLFDFSPSVISDDKADSVTIDVCWNAVGTTATL